MDEQRMQAYVELIGQLLKCPQGEEAMLLQAHSNLLDEGLLAAMEQVAVYLESQGSGNAQWLRGFAAQLAKTMGLKQAALQEADAARNFLLEMLQLIVDQQGNPQQIYHLWAQQQTRFNAELIAVLPSVAAELLQEYTEQRTFIAAVLGTLGDLIQQFPLGAHWINLELGIAAYEQALQVRNHETMPIEWAALMHNLALAYSERIRGDRAENIETAIAALQQALQVRTRETMPLEWAASMNNLAAAYTERIRGDRAENIETAIVTSKQALQVRIRKTMPVEWAESMHNLALAYYSRIQGDRAENIETAIAALQQALQVRTRETMPVEWTVSMNNLAAAYYSRIQGDRGQNIEDAIAALQQVLKVTTRETMPVEWAASMNNLATAYTERIQGNRAENIEAAIVTSKQALQVRTREAMPIEWAETMNNLAVAYRNRIRGDRGQNIEDAIAALQQALQVRTREAMPIEWATVMHNLATIYRERIQGDRTENMEAAIAAYEQALQVRTHETMPIEWAQSMHDLAAAYYSRIRGDRAENMEVAIAALQQALQVRTREIMPIEWAQSMHDLAVVYSERIRGDQAENMEAAIAALQQALQVRTRETMPVEWAASMNNLATTYFDHIRGDQAENMESVIAALQQALQVRTRETMPIEWAQSMNNLANAYANRIWGDRGQNIENAIATRQQALQVMTRQAMPVEWAQSMHNLALAYAKRIRGDRGQNIENAIVTLQTSLEIRTPELLPNDCRSTAHSLGNLYFGETRWKEAVSVYQTALKAAETLYQSANLLDSKAAELSETADLPRRTAYALARIGELQQAVETLEQGRARGLSESLDRDRAELTQLQQTHPSVYQDYRAIANQLRNLESQQRDRMTSEDRYILTPGELRDSAIALRQQLDTLIQSIRQVPGYEKFLTLPTFDDVRRAVRSDCPLIYLVPTSAGSLALVVMIDQIEPVRLNHLPESKLREILYGSVDDPELGRWFGAYQDFRNDAKANYLAWFEEIDRSTRQLWEPLMQPLIQHLKDHQFHQATLIPTGLLSFLPLHAAWTEDTKTPTGRRYALDDIHFTYAPNARSLTAARVITQYAPVNSILAIDNPCQDLPNSGREVAAAIASFSRSKVLRHKEATVESVLTALPDYNFLHLSCHGIANLGEPLNSGLAMSDGLLTLRDLLNLRLSEQDGIRLAILSACETGLVGVELADEAIGLPTGLLQAGVSGVVASLWSVSDLSTMMLLIRFYDLWRKDGINPSEALRQAQRWVRDTTNRQKYDYFKSKLSDPLSSQGQSGITKAFLNKFMLNYVYPSSWEARDFAHPFHWAAFIYVGV